MTTWPPVYTEPHGTASQTWWVRLVGIVTYIHSHGSGQSWIRRGPLAITIKSHHHVPSERLPGVALWQTRGAYMSMRKEGSWRAPKRNVVVARRTHCRHVRLQVPSHSDCDEALRQQGPRQKCSNKWRRQSSRAPVWPKLLRADASNAS